MPRDVDFGILEMGMNNAGEIAALTRLVRPNLALITAIAPAHIENLGSEEAIADAKAEIFEGLEPDGVAIIPNDTPHRGRLVKAARRYADRMVTFGTGDADVHALHAVRSDDGGSLITAALLDHDLTFTISQRGEHWVSNALAVLSAVEAVGGDLGLAGLAFAEMGGLKGRGQRHRLPLPGGDALLIDESYNANPASMAATLKSLGRETGVERRIAVLGPMRELGIHANQLHAALAPAVLAANVDELVLVGGDMAPLAEALGGQVHMTEVADADSAADAVAGLLRPGDAVLVKASNSVGLARVIDRLTKEIAECSTS
jgi:UDP-N-acetylmuramoyl-tripeptide--D-alanyl-D-alanine ligase